MFDENLSPKLCTDLSDIFPGCTHVCNEGLRSAEDVDVSAFAFAHGFAVVTKDKDFPLRSYVLMQRVPKVILVRLRDASVRDIARVLRESRAVIEKFLVHTDRIVLVLPVRTQFQPRSS